MSQSEFEGTIDFPRLCRYTHWSNTCGKNKKTTPSCRYMMQSEKNRQRILIWVSLVFLVTCIGIWTRSQPDRQNQRAVRNGTKHGIDTIDATSTSTPSQATQHPIQIGSLDAALLLAASGAQSHPQDRAKRLIFIGDIHGCIDELKKLLRKAEYDERYDHIIAAGDMINKGPNSHAVVDFLLRKRAFCVRGNHDDKILKLVEDTSTAGNLETITDNDPERTLARTLTSDQLSYLRSCPIILKIGRIGEKHFVVVHGGLVPSLPLDQQDSYHVMNMRILETATHQPSKDHEKAGFKPWTELWHEYQLRPAAQDGVVDRSLRPAGSSVTTVIYGHDARRGLQIKQFSKGLDSGCVKGKKLTAFIVDAQGVEEFVQVKCREYRS